MIARDELHGNVNPQYEADHKCDEALFLDKKYIERKLDVMKYGYECEKEWTARATGRIRLDRAEKSCPDKPVLMQFPTRKNKRNVCVYLMKISSAYESVRFRYNHTL